MARTMSEKNVGTFRTVVTTTWNEEYKEPGYYGYVHEAGETRTEIFGPYADKSHNQNYSYLSLGYHGPAVPRERQPWHSDYEWNTYFKDKTIRPYIIVATQEIQKQELKPVLALNANGSLELALDWVTYANR